MKHNMSTADRIIRVIIALIITVLTYYGVIPGIWGITSIVIAAIFVITAFINFCPLYTALGIRRWEIKSQTAERD